jgi:hypothetical protein
MPLRDLEFHSHENLDSGFARNLRTVFLGPSAECVQSIFSCQFEVNGKRLVTPNREYPCERLMVHQDGENCRFREFFSRPFGNNACLVDCTCRNPVPVKNPIQFWSRWCDPIAEFFRKGVANP